MMMNNPQEGEYGIKIGEKEYTLLFNNRAIASLEKALGVKSLYEMVDLLDLQKLKYETLIQFLKFGLMTRHPNEADEIANNLLPRHTMNLFPQVMMAFKAAMPEVPDEETDSKGNPTIAGEVPNHVNGSGLR